METTPGARRVGTLPGTNIKLYVDITFFVLLAFPVMSLISGGLQAGLDTLLFISIILLFIFLHELGHVWMADRFHAPCSAMTFMAFGAFVSSPRLAVVVKNPTKELLITLAGPLVNLVSFFLLMTVWVLFGPSELLPTGRHATTPLMWQVVDKAIVANLLLFVFNMLPAFPMDGGKILRAIAGYYFISQSKCNKIVTNCSPRGDMSFDRATLFSTRVGLVVLGLLALFGIVMGDLWMAFIAVFLGMSCYNQMKNVKRKLELE